MRILGVVCNPSKPRGRRAFTEDFKPAVESSGYRAGAPPAGTWNCSSNSGQVIFQNVLLANHENARSQARSPFRFQECVLVRALRAQVVCSDRQARKGNWSRLCPSLVRSVTVPTGIVRGRAKSTKTKREKPVVRHVLYVHAGTSC
jgi:hypothetical protein